MAYHHEYDDLEDDLDEDLDEEFAEDELDESREVIVERRNGKYGAFFVGIAIGAGLALMLAPQSGEELRRNMRKQAKRARRAAGDLAHDVRDRAGELIDDAKERAEDLVEEVRDRAEHVADDARDRYKHGRRRVSRAVDAGRAAARDARDELERRIAEARR